MFGSLFKSKKRDKVQSISPKDAYEMLNQGESITLIDVRSASEFNGGHVPQARLMPLQMLASRANELTPEQPLLVICASGMRSRMAGEQLTDLGFTQVYNVKGGLRAWVGAGLPVR